MLAAAVPTSVEIWLCEGNSVVFPQEIGRPADYLSAMRRLLTPVNAGVSAARHLIWYLSYHSGSRREH